VSSRIGSISFARSGKNSRALRQSERNWAQIEKEELSMLYGLERFDQYTYGRKVIVQNDHKPLVAIPFLTSRSLASGKLSNAFTFMIRGRCSQSSSLSLHTNALLNASARLHSSHLGYDSMMRKARNTIFWPGITKDVKQLADNCEICQESKPRNCRETRYSITRKMFL
jgi:hypothetical protein